MTDHITRAPELYGWRSDQYLITMDSAEAAESGIGVFTRYVEWRLSERCHVDHGWGHSLSR